jgi:ethanolamine utilization microcompartment shell protein EutL
VHDHPELVAPMKSGFYSNRPRYEERQQQAQARQAAYNKLSTVEKLAALDKDGVTAVKQRARLAKSLTAAGNGKKTTTIVAPYRALPAIEKAPKNSDFDVIVGMVPAPPKGQEFTPAVISNSRAERRRARKAGKSA